MVILAIDPGQYDSAYVVYDTKTAEILNFNLAKNEVIVGDIKKLGVRAQKEHKEYAPIDMMVLEIPKSYGMAIGDSILETCVWLGRFAQTWESFGGNHTTIPRKTVVTQICLKPTANDSNVRQALIDKYGGKEKAIGTKAQPGVLKGIVNDLWAALAVAVAYGEIQDRKSMEAIYG